VTSAKIKNKAVTAGKINTSGLTVPNSHHATIADSATSATNATSATSATNATNSAQLGGITAAHYTRPGATLASGDIETGVYGASGPSSGLGVAEITFVPKLAAAPTASEYVAGAGTAACPGPGQASAGRLCVYQGFINGMTLDNICSPVQACGGSPTALGAEVYFITSSGAANTVGTWAYKAP
jgi:hypothetical protein